MKKLLWRCDDFGSATGANEGIQRVARLGLPVNVSVLICGPAAQVGLDQLAGLGPQVFLGIHAALNSEWAGVKWGPVGAPARGNPLADDRGFFYPDNDVISKLPPEIIAAEVEAQIQRALEWKVPFSYMDEHMGFAWIPGVASLLVKLASKYGLVYRRNLPGLPEVQEGSADPVRHIELQLAAVADDQPRLAVFHPSLDDASTRGFYLKDGVPGHVSRERQQEVDFLTSPAWKKLVTGEGVKLVTYRDV